MNATHNAALNVIGQGVDLLLDDLQHRRHQSQPDEEHCTHYYHVVRLRRNHITEANGQEGNKDEVE